MYINPGELDKRIKIMMPVAEGRDEDLFPIKSERLIRTCWAKVTDTSGTEILKANSEFSQAKRRFLVRYTPTEINTDMFVRYGGDDYNIIYVNPYGDSMEYVEIWTELSERVGEDDG